MPRHFNSFLPIKITRHAPTTDVIMVPMMFDASNPMRPKRKLPTKPPASPRMIFLIHPPLLCMIAPAIHPDTAPVMIPRIIPKIFLLFNA